MADTTTMHISLPKTMKTFVEDILTQEGYGTTSEYVKALIRADQKRKEAEELEQVLLKAITNGEAEELTDDVWNNLKDKVQKQITKNKK